MQHLQGNTLPWEGVSHNPEIMKRVFLRSGDVPVITTFGQAVLQPGQSVTVHQHETMYEVFYVLDGVARFVIAGNTLEVKAGDCVVIEPNEQHEQLNPFSVPVSWVYFGVATGNNSVSDAGSK